MQTYIQMAHEICTSSSYLTGVPFRVVYPLYRPFSTNIRVNSLLLIKIMRRIRIVFLFSICIMNLNNKCVS